MSKSVSPGQEARRAVAHPFEREAVGLLCLSGWSVRELAMVFECSETAIRRVLDDQGVEL